METGKPETYPKLHARQQKEVNDFPMFFAFSNQQFAEGMKELGLTPDDTNKIYKLGNTGGYYLRTDAERLHSMFDRHAQELEAAMKDADFAVGAFKYQLNNHEYCVTHDSSDALGALGLTDADVEGSKTLKSALSKAVKQYWSDYEAMEKRQKKPPKEPPKDLLGRVAGKQKKVDAYKELTPPSQGQERKKSAETLE